MANRALITMSGCLMCRPRPKKAWSSTVQAGQASGRWWVFEDLRVRPVPTSGSSP